jgi:hypothetical protein
MDEIGPTQRQSKDPPDARREEIDELVASVSKLSAGSQPLRHAGKRHERYAMNAMPHAALKTVAGVRAAITTRQIGPAPRRRVGRSFDPRPTPSMRHEHRQIGLRQNLACDFAENDLTQPAAGIAALDQEIRS